MASGAVGVCIPDHNTRFLNYFDFYIDHFLHHLFKADWYKILLFYLDYVGEFQAFLKIGNNS